MCFENTSRCNNSKQLSSRSAHTSKESTYLQSSRFSNAFSNNVIKQTLLWEMHASLYCFQQFILKINWNYILLLQNLYLRWLNSSISNTDLFRGERICNGRSPSLRKKYEGYFNFYRPSFNSKEPIFWGILKSFFIPISSFSLFLFSSNEVPFWGTLSLIDSISIVLF